MSWRLAAGTLALFFCLAARGVNITGFSPASGQPGNVITINGSGFTGTTMVQFNNNSTPTLGDFTNVSDGQLLVVVPQGASSGPLVVFVGNSSATSGASFLVAPVITGFAPQSGANPNALCPVCRTLMGSLWLGQEDAAAHDSLRIDAAGG